MVAKERIFDLGERHVFGRRRFQALFHRLHQVALTGLDYGLDDPRLNGEYALIDRRAADWTCQPVVFDAGSFRGEWSAAVLKRDPDARIFTFEPNSDSFERIQARLGDRVSVHPFALGAEDATASLSAPRGIPQMGSLHVRNLEQFDLVVDGIDSVEVRSLESSCAEHGIDGIELLKLEVEGHELAGLRGAAGMLAPQAIAAVQFEFGGAALDSRVFLRNLLEVLSEYRGFRIVRDGPDPLTRYDERAKIFTLFNFVALRTVLPSPQDQHGCASSG